MNRRDPTKNPLPLRERVASGEAASRVRGKKLPRAVTPATKRARELRQASTRAEAKLWRVLRARQFEDAKFRRQVPIGTYFADFLSYELRMIVEVDGGQHADNGRDRRRDAWFEANGYRVLRFWNTDVLSNIDGVVELISLAMSASPSPRRAAQDAARRPSPAGGEGKNAPASQPRAAAKPPSPTRGEGKKRANAATTRSPTKGEGKRAWSRS